MPESSDLRRMAATIQAFARAFAAAGRDAQVIDFPGVVASVCPAIGFRSVFNAAAHTNTDALETALPRLRSSFDDAGIEAWGVWAHESDSLAGSLLAEAGLVQDSSPAAMATDIAEIEAPDGELIVERAEHLEDFDRVLAAAYEFPAGAMVYCFPGLLESFDCYIARQRDGDPVAVAATVDHDGDCGVNLVATSPDARGQGFASAVMRHAIAAALQRGCTTTTLQATAVAKSMYERLGYRDLGTYWLWERRRRPAQ